MEQLEITTKIADLEKRVANPHIPASAVAALEKMIEDLKIQIIVEEPTPVIKEESDVVKALRKEILDLGIIIEMEDKPKIIARLKQEQKDLEDIILMELESEDDSDSMEVTLGSGKEKYNALSEEEKKKLLHETIGIGTQWYNEDYDRLGVSHQRAVDEHFEANKMANGGFIKTQFNSHENHNPDTDILEGHIDSDSFITYAIDVNGKNKGKESMEYYSGENYVVGSKKKSSSRHYEADKIPAKYKPLWLELKSIYESKMFANGGEIVALKDEDYVWDENGNKFIVGIEEDNDKEYFLYAYGKSKPTPMAKEIVDEHIKTGFWTLKPKLAKGGKVNSKIKFTDNDYKRLIDDRQNNYPFFSTKSGNYWIIKKEKDESSVAKFYPKKEELVLNGDSDLNEWLENNSYK